jgi:DNA mismatch repair protein MutS
MSKIQPHLWYRQYQDIKAQHADAILLYRFGDFYEIFGDDAKLASSLLDITLAKREYASGKGEKHYCAMAGVPYHAVESYIARLVNQGYRVAIAEQMSETPSSKNDTRRRSTFDSGKRSEKQRGIVHREVVRVITPGTLTDPTMLQAEENNYLATVIVQKDAIGFSYADLSTGEFAATTFRGEGAANEVAGELVRLQVAEILVPDDESLRLPSLTPSSARLEHDLAPMTKEERETLLPHERVARRLEGQETSTQWAHGRVTAVPSWRWEHQTAADALMQQLGVASLAGYGLDQAPLATRAAGALVQYINETLRKTAAQITSLHVYTTSSWMFLDPQTRRNLELLESATGRAKGALISVLDHTRTPMGGRLLRRWLSQPLLTIDTLRKRQDAVACGVDEGLLRAEVRQALGGIGDMERTVNRILQGVGSATPRDLVQLRQALRALPQVIEAIGDRTALLYDEVQERASHNAPHQHTYQPQDLNPCHDVRALLERALDENPPALLGVSNYLGGGGDGEEKARRVIRPGYDKKIDSVVEANRDAQRYINNLENRESERTGIKSLKVGYNKVFGYYIEISRAAAANVPSHYERKQTLANAERYITAELKEYESIILNAQQQLAELEREAFWTICHEVARYGDELRTTARLLAHIDVYMSLGEAAVRGRYVRPTLTEDTTLHIKGGRHPVVEQSLPEPFVANDVTLDTQDQQLLIITGANMAGKSTVLRQVALTVLLAQVGSFVPADEAQVGLVDRIFTRIGAQDDIATGQSTFMVEMTETAALLMQSTAQSLIILDEVGRGTSTYDGMAIARAVVEYIHNEPRLRCRTLFATHYHELTVLEELLPRVRNEHMAAVEQDGRVVFLYELRQGSADRSYGIHVAELAGIPRSVIRRANEILAELEGRGEEPAIREKHKHAVHDTSTADSAEGQDEDEEGSGEDDHAPQQYSLFDAAPNPVVEYLKRLRINDLTPIEAMTKLYELQRLATTPIQEQ